MNPTPSPSPLVVQIVGGEAAPWWGVPVIAGAFLLIGAVVAFLLNRSLEASKATREARTRWHTDVRSLGAEVLAIALQMTDTYDLIQSTGTENQVVRERRSALKVELTRLRSTLLNKINEVVIVAPPLTTVMFEYGYQAHTATLEVEPYKDARIKAIADLQTARANVVTGLREYLGINDIPRRDIEK
jgi:hypothetical protein